MKIAITGGAGMLGRKLAGRLAADVPERAVDAAHGEAGARAHAMAGELLVVDLFPHAHHVGGVHPFHQLRERGLDEFGDGGMGAAVMRFAPADQPAGRGDLHHHRVALDGGTDAQRHAVLRRHRERGGVGLDVSNPEICAQ